jgi:hypothetical protein
VKIQPQWAVTPRKQTKKLISVIKIPKYQNKKEIGKNTQIITSMALWVLYKFGAPDSLRVHHMRQSYNTTGWELRIRTYQRYKRRYSLV